MADSITDTLGVALKTALASIVSLYYLEAETNVYPYAWYDREITEHRTKDGLYKIQSAVSINIVSKSYAELKQLTSAVRAAVAGIDQNKFTVKFLTSDASCIDDVWTNVLTYNIYQIA